MRPAGLSHSRPDKRLAAGTVHPVWRRIRQRPVVRPLLINASIPKPGNDISTSCYDRYGAPGRSLAAERYVDAVGVDVMAVDIHQRDFTGAQAHLQLAIICPAAAGLSGAGTGVSNPDKMAQRLSGVRCLPTGIIVKCAVPVWRCLYCPASK